MTVRIRSTALAALVLCLCGAAAAQTPLGDWFARRDANGDGYLTRAEWQAAREVRLQQIDTNGDGAISREEFLAYEARRAEARADRLFRRLDLDGDGVISTAEREAALARRFQRVDSDGDGRISREELDRARIRFRARGGENED